MKYAVLTCLAASCCQADLITFGVRGGMPLSEAFRFDRPYNAGTKLYTVGPTLEVHLPLRTSVAFDVLYRRLGYSGTPFGPDQFRAVTANAWEFPVLLKHRLRGEGSARPYLGVGPTFGRITGVTEYVAGVVRGDSPFELRRRNAAGIVFAGGVEIRGPLIISPEIRYGRRFADYFRSGPVLQSNRNQIDFVLGITF